MKQHLLLSVAATTTLLLAACSQTATHRCVTTLPPAIQIDRLTDATVAAQFTSTDFDWTSRTLTMTVFSEDLYDAMEIHQLSEGDTLSYNGILLVVASKKTEGNGQVTINGGLEEGGAYLDAYEGGTYRAMQFDGHSIYTNLGRVDLPLSNDFTLIDCGNDFKDPYDTITDNHQSYLSTLVNYKQEFHDINTLVTVTNGKLTRIVRKWIP